MSGQFKQELENRTIEIEKILRACLPEETGYQKTILAAVNYSMASGGKRLRPLFLVECNKMLYGKGAADPTVCAFAAAIEMIHAYSLVHDDLPAMDDDKYRRGRLTTHMKYGEAMGILAGDALLNRAFETVSAALAKEQETERILAGVRALHMLSKKSGMYGMLGGQVVDVEKTGKTVAREELEFIYRLKTGALLEASMAIGGILAGAADKEIQTLEAVAAATGMAFQIQDDILDVTSSLEVLGKPVHSDEKNEKNTYVTLYSLEEASRKVEELSEEAIRLLEELPGEKEFVKQLILSLAHREK